VSQYTPDSFAVNVLRRLGAPRTRANMKAMRAWIAQEGGHWHNDARFNPLNTTQPEAGSTTFRSVGRGAADIRIYRTPEQGIEATVATLKNGRYGNILSALQRGSNAAAVASAIESSPWGTHHINLSGASSKAPKATGSYTAASISPGVMNFSATQTPASEIPSREASVIMALQHRSHSGKLPHLGGGSLLKEADYLYRTGQATDIQPGSYASKIVTTPTTATGSRSTPTPAVVHGSGKFKITGPNPNRLKPELVAFARKVAAQAGETLTGSDGSTHSKYTVDGNVSEHWTGNATDIPATGTRLVHLGQAALIAAGMPRNEALKQHGGLFNVGNHQIIFNTHIGGDHTDHLHISTHARR
jgi:hypothetical protein